jgi:hypothetical protein
MLIVTESIIRTGGSSLVMCGSDMGVVSKKQIIFVSLHLERKRKIFLTRNLIPDNGIMLEEFLC